MENVNPPDLLRHLEKESEVLTRAHESINNELSKLQVEEDMLMHTFYNILSAQGLLKMRENINSPGMYQNQVPEEFPARQTEQDGHQNELSRALVVATEDAELLFLEGSQIEADENQAPLLLLQAAKEDIS